MTYAATYNRIRHFPDVWYDVTCRATTVGNALPAVAFPSHDWHTAVFTGPYPGPRGPWHPVYRSFRYKKVMASLSPWHILAFSSQSCGERCKPRHNICVKVIFESNYVPPLLLWPPPLTSLFHCLARGVVFFLFSSLLSSLFRCIISWCCAWWGWQWAGWSWGIWWWFWFFRRDCLNQ